MNTGGIFGFWRLKGISGQPIKECVGFDGMVWRLVGKGSGTIFKAEHVRNPVPPVVLPISDADSRLAEIRGIEHIF